VASFQNPRWNPPLPKGELRGVRAPRASLASPLCIHSFPEEWGIKGVEIGRGDISGGFRSALSALRLDSRYPRE